MPNERESAQKCDLSSVKKKKQTTRRVFILQKGICLSSPIPRRENWTSAFLQTKGSLQIGCSFTLHIAPRRTILNPWNLPVFSRCRFLKFTTERKRHDSNGRECLLLQCPEFEHPHPGWCKLRQISILLPADCLCK